MSDKQKRAINAGRKKAGLKPIKFKSKGKVLKNVWIKNVKKTKSKISSDDLKRRKMVAKSEKLYKEDPKKWNLEKPKTKKLFKK